MESMIRRALPAALFCLAASVLPALANEYEAQLRALNETLISTIVADPAIIAAINAQNAKNAGLTQADIDALDKSWRAEAKVGSHPTIDPVLNNPVSDMLRARRDESGGLFTEIFVMDDRGLNVATAEITSDYWQGDEAKWQKTYEVGPGAIHMSEVELDQSTQTYQTQISVAICDPATGKPIGAATFGVNVALLN
jgi:hypothetical protein